MIRKLSILDVNATPISWWPKVDALKELQEITFEPERINILWAPNGIGKSTIIRALARMTHCEQGGVPKVTRESIGHFVGREGKVNGGMCLLADGQPTFHYDPNARVGFLDNGAAYDHDFFSEGVLQSVSIQFRSSGQQAQRNTARILENAVKTTGIDSTLLRQVTDDALREIIGNGLTNTMGETGRPTLLLDEPGRSIDLPNQVAMWKSLTRQTHFQLIVATHSPLALEIEGARYLDLQPGYLEECRYVFRKFASAFLDSSAQRSSRLNED